ncbi:MAG TPA: SBBP repeat-containing protein [Bryobacteraceae bacterium]|nr:SBBP repeat-containing protein [Bryobacteraceae bacterium]
MTLRFLLIAFAAANAFGAAAPDFRNLPISFEPNRGQFARGVQFGARAGGLLVGVTGRGVQFQLGGAPVTMTWKHGRTSIGARGVDSLPGKANYFLGSDSKLWATDIPTYKKILVPDIYKGIDLVIYGTSSRLEYDLDLASGASPKNIALQVDGVQRITISKQGDLLLCNGGASIVQHRPRVYQVIQNHKMPVRAKYVLRGKFEVGFELAAYDHRKPVIIDPELSFSTAFGGGGADVVESMAVDPSGNVYLVGTTTSTNFPTAGAYENTNSNGYSHMFVIKLDPTGSTVLFSTYLGGSGTESADAIAVDGSGAMYIAGSTTSPDYPITLGAIRQGDTAHGFSDVAVTKLSPSGSSLVFSAVIGGSDNEQSAGIAIDSGGDSFITGTTRSFDFPVTAGARNDLSQMNGAAANTKIFVMKLSPLANALSYSAVVGGTGPDSVAGIALDSTGAAYVAGTTGSKDFPVTANAFQKSFKPEIPQGGAAGSETGYIFKLASDGSALQFGTYLGGAGDDAITGIALDSANGVYVTGVTTSSDFPTVPGSYSFPTNGAKNAVFVTKLKADASALVYSSLFGGNTNSVGGIAVDSSKEAIVTGGIDANLLVTTGAPQIVPGSGPLTPSGSPHVSNAFVVKLNSDGTGATLGTYLGGAGAVGKAVAVDANGGIYVTGSADATFPVTAGSFRTISPGQIFVAKIVDPSPCTYSLQPVSTLTVNVITQAGCHWIAVPGVSWLAVSSGSSGMGNGTVQLMAEPNSGIERSGVVSIAGNSYTVVQPVACQVTLSANSQRFEADGGSDQFSAFTSPECALPAAVTSQQWIHVKSPIAGLYTYTVDAASQPRSGSITVGVQSYSVTQSASPCAFSVSPNPVTVPVAGTTVVTITADNYTCPWSATSDSSKIFFIPSQGQGTSTITVAVPGTRYAVAPSSAATIAGKSVQLNVQGTIGAYIGGKAGVFRGGQWWLDVNGDGSWSSPQDALILYGYPGDYPIMGDWDNTGRMRLGVFRGGNWWLDINGDGAWDATHDIEFTYGYPGDIPIVGDWDHTGKQRIGVFRNGNWWLDMNGDHKWSGGADIVFSFGQAGDYPLVGDWDNTGWQRVGIFRDGQWWLDLNGDHLPDTMFYYGYAGDIPLVGDWDNTGKQRIGVFRNGQWWLDRNNDHSWSSPQDMVFTYGYAGDIPVLTSWQ